MLHTFKNGQTSVVLRAKLLDSTSTTGAGLTGLTNASASLIISTIADNEATAVAYTVAGSTVETITTLGTYATPTATKCRFKEVDSTNHKGVYEFQFADARFAVASAKSLLVSVSGATNLQQAEFLIQLQTFDPYVAPLTAAQIATGVWTDTTAGDFTTALSVGKSVMNGVTLGTGLTVNTVTNQLTAAQIATGVWTDTTAGDFTTSLSIGKSVLNGVALGTGLTVNDITTKTGFSLSQTFPSNFSSLGISAGGHITTVDTVTTVTNQLTAAAIATGVWTDTVAGDFTTSLSVGKSVMNGVTLGTGLTVNDITTKSGYSLSSTQTFDVTGNITGNLSGSVGSVSGAVGSVTGLTASNLDATISSRMATYTQPTGFLAATFPGTVASTTNITAGTITTVTTLTGLTASDVGAIKLKTDSLTFTVAGYLDTNILKVNSVTVNGIGTVGSPWGP